MKKDDVFSLWILLIQMGGENEMPQENKERLIIMKHIINTIAGAALTLVLFTATTMAAENSLESGVNMQSARLIKQVQPLYPQTAKQTRIQGMVKFNAMIAKDGSIQNLQAISGHPLLVPAAVDAVKQWRYEPTMLAGNAVAVATQIEVRFALR